VYALHDVSFALSVNVPLPHAVHSWSALDVPAVETYVPAAQSVYAVHEV
jgi:hypothetical protein